MPNTLVQVAFHDAQVVCVMHDGKPFVALRPLCDALEIAWEAQFRAIKKDPVLASTVDDLSTVGADGKSRSMLCLPLDYLNGWLFKIDAGRYKPGDPRRDRIIAYQRECYRVLRDRFMPALTDRPTMHARPWESDTAARRASRLVGKLRRLARNRRLSKAAMHAAVELACFGESDRLDGPLAQFLLSRIPETNQPKGALPC